jgi:plastocyanin
MRAFPRTVRATAAIALALAGFVVFASPAVAKGKAPVKLDGKVNNKGVGAAPNGSADIELDDFYFKKTFIKAPAGSVTVDLVNEGSAQHSFTIDDQNIDVVVSSGQTKTVTLTASDTAPTTFYCKFHVGQGMKGAVFVKAGGTGANTKTDSKPSDKAPSGPGGYDYGG